MLCPLLVEVSSLVLRQSTFLAPVPLKLISNPTLQARRRFLITGKLDFASSVLSLHSREMNDQVIQQKEQSLPLQLFKVAQL